MAILRNGLGKRRGMGFFHTPLSNLSHKRREETSNGGADYSLRSRMTAVRRTAWEKRGIKAFLHSPSVLSPSQEERGLRLLIISVFVVSFRYNNGVV